jgi:hypothetical protein
MLRLVALFASLLLFFVVIASLLRNGLCDITMRTLAQKRAEAQCTASELGVDSR